MDRPVEIKADRELLKALAGPDAASHLRMWLYEHGGRRISIIAAKQIVAAIQSSAPTPQPPVDSDVVRKVKILAAALNRVVEAK